jgi:hypothetical protein
MTRINLLPNPRTVMQGAAKGEIDMIKVVVGMTLMVLGIIGSICSFFVTWKLWHSMGLNPLEWWALNITPIVSIIGGSLINLILRQ